MALKLNAHIARLLHGKELDLSAEMGQYDLNSNPLLAFQTHFNMSQSFTSEVIGMQLWNDLMPIVNSAEMPKSPFNFWWTLILAVQRTQIAKMSHEICINIKINQKFGLERLIWLT